MLATTYRYQVDPADRHGPGARPVPAVTRTRRNTVPMAVETNAVTMAWWVERWKLLREEPERLGEIVRECGTVTGRDER